MRDVLFEVVGTSFVTVLVVEKEKLGLGKNKEENELENKQ